MRSRRHALLARRRAHLAAATLAALAALAGCERRIEEPVAPSLGGDGFQGQAAPAPAPAPSTEPARCIRPTPDAPPRAVARGGAPDPACPADPTGPPELRSGKVVFLDAKAPDVLVEIAENDKDRARGLMYRTAMPEHRGMLFVFKERRNHSFWMHNTCIPLDMLFLDTDGMIVGIEENTPTMNDGTFAVGCPSLYVLELNAGWARSHGVVAGQKVKLEGL